QRSRAPRRVAANRASPARPVPAINPAVPAPAPRPPDASHPLTAGAVARVPEGASRLMTEPSPEPPGRRFPWWVLAGAVLLPGVYLPTLATRFDFIDD